MRSFILSQCRDLRMGVIWEALTTLRVDGVKLTNLTRWMRITSCMRTTTTEAQKFDPNRPSPPKSFNRSPQLSRQCVRNQKTTSRSTTRWRLRRAALQDNYRSQERSISADKMYSTVCIEWALIILVLVWRKPILFAEYISRKRFAHVVPSDLDLWHLAFRP